MVAPILFCNVCSGAPCDVHIVHANLRPMSFNETHFCSTACMDAYMSKNDPNEYVALYMTKQSPGALLNGTIIEKVNSEPGDGHPDGTVGEIVGSMDEAFIPALGRRMRAYFVKWGDFMAPVGTADFKVKKKD